MPCDTNLEISVAFGKNTNEALMVKALRGLGMNVRVDGKMIYLSNNYTEYINLETGECALNPVRDPAFVNEIKRAYSKQVVVTQAKKFGWNIQKIAKDKYLTRRK